MNYTSKCTGSDCLKCQWLNEDELILPDPVMDLCCSIVHFLELLGNINSMKEYTNSKVCFSKSDLPYDVAVVDHQGVKGKTLMRNFLLDWNRYNQVKDKPRNVIDRKYILGENNIFGRDYEDFKSFCTEFDKLCLEIETNNGIGDVCECPQWTIGPTVAIAI